VQHISRPLDHTILEQMPVSIVIFRASDQVLVYANEFAQKISGYSASDFGKVSLWDLLVEEDASHAYSEANKSAINRATVDGDPSEGFARLRAKNGAVSTFWFTIKDIIETDGHVRFRIVVAFVDYDEQARSEHWMEYIDMMVDASERRSAGVIASELNNALAVLQIGLESQDLLHDKSLNKALETMTQVADRLHRLATKYTESPYELEKSEILQMKQVPRDVTSVSGKKILVVDDDQLLLEALNDLLSIHGFRVHTATHTSQAIAHVHEFSPDLALIDLRLGTEDGRETAKLLTASNPSLKIVFMTGFADSLLAIRNEGRYKVLKKPFQIESFISIIQREVAK